MNKRTVMASLNKIANELDNNGLHNEADTVTKVMSRLAYDERDYMNDSMEHNTEDMGYCPDCSEWIGDSEHCEDCGWGMEDEGDMGDDFDMGPESEPFDYSSPEDDGDMYGDDFKGYMDKDSDF